MGEATVRQGDSRDMTYEYLLEHYQHYDLTRSPNLFHITPNILDVSEEGMNLFNEIIELIHSLGLKKGIKRTTSGGISIENPRTWIDRYDITRSGTAVEILFCYDHWFRFAFRRNYKKDRDGINGHRAFVKFLEVCRKFDAKIDDLRISSEEGEAVKTLIPSPIIDISEGVQDQTIYNVHHIDIHSSHMAGVAKAFPQLYPAINYCYENRHGAPIYKHILTHTWGYMQSQYSPVYYQFSHLSKYGIEFTNNTVNDLTKRLTESGRRVLMHNTDGIWYEGEIYHGEGEGKALGEWENDHTNCTFRAKSKGAYEYIEEGQYYAVVRGRTELDKKKSRERWSWGDIYHTGHYDSYEYDPDTEKIYYKEALE